MLVATHKEGVAGEATPFSKIPFYIQQVKTKLASGEYPTDQTKCFCGSEDDIILINQDRYTIPHRMVICKDCGILRANPRMTQTAYDHFYNDEYRPIYDAWEFAGKKNDKESIFINGLKDSQKLHEFIEYFDLNPKVVFDIGCNIGINLLPFKEHGVDCYGVDLNAESIAYGRTKGLNLIHGDIAELQKLGKKADFIIINHVLEHILDPEHFLAQVSGLLSPKGLLYIGVPGLFNCSPHLVFQNAHVWQFTDDTLTYLMKCCGYEEYFTNEVINSVWAYTGDKMPKDNYPKQVFQPLQDYLSGKENKAPMVKTFNKFTFKERKDNIDKTLSYGYPDIQCLTQTMKDKEAVILGGGPSIDAYPEKIKEMQKNGVVIISIERMYQWCFKHGITPDFVLCMDASDDVVEGFTQINPKTKHILATQCLPAAFELVKEYDNYIFSLPQRGIDQPAYWQKHGYKRVTIVNGGGSVTLASMAIAMTFGMKKIHIFGFDCHMTGTGYADGIAGVGIQKGLFTVAIEGRDFITNSSYLSFMQQFFLLYGLGKENKLLEDVKIYGDSMVKAVSTIDIDGDK